MSVTNSVLWCCDSWLLTQVEKRRLQTTQNRMLRRIVPTRRREEESYVDWIQRATRQAVNAAKAAGIRFWVEGHHAAKWQWAGHLARMSEDRLASRATFWRDSLWWKTEMQLPQSLRIRRPFRTHWFRWEDDLRRYADRQGWDSWQAVAQDRQQWKSASADFVKFSKGI